MNETGTDQYKLSIIYNIYKTWGMGKLHSLLRMKQLVLCALSLYLSSAIPLAVIS